MATINVQGTACKRCKHFYRESQFNRDMWYNHYCSAANSPDYFDYYSGKIIPGGKKLCRNVNDGNCPFYEEEQ